MKVDKDIAQRPVRLMRKDEVMRVIGIKKSTLSLWIKNGTFPAPVQLGERVVAWSSHVVDQWIRNKINGANS